MSYEQELDTLGQLYSCGFINKDEYRLRVQRLPISYRNKSNYNNYNNFKQRQQQNDDQRNYSNYYHSNLNNLNTNNTNTELNNNVKRTTVMKGGGIETYYPRELEIHDTKLQDVIDQEELTFLPRSHSPPGFDVEGIVERLLEVNPFSFQNEQDGSMYYVAECEALIENKRKKQWSEIGVSNTVGVVVISENAIIVRRPKDAQYRLVLLCFIKWLGEDVAKSVKSNRGRDYTHYFVCKGYNKEIPPGYTKPPVTVPPEVVSEWAIDATPIEGSVWDADWQGSSTVESWGT